MFSSVGKHRGSALIESAIASVRARGLDPDDEAALLRAMGRAPAGGLVRMEALECLLREGVATRESLPLLKRLCTGRNEWEQSAALSGVAAIAGADAMAFYRGLLRDRRFRLKIGLFGGELWWWGGEPDVSTAAALLRARYRIRPRMDFSGWGTPACTLLRFMLQFPENQDTRACVGWVRRNWKRFPPTERATLARSFPQLGDLDGCERWVALVGRPSLMCARLYNDLYTSGVGVLPINLAHPNAALHARLAAPYVSGVVSFRKSWLADRAHSGSGVRGRVPALILQPTGPLGAVFPMPEAEAIERANEKRLLRFLRSLGAGLPSGRGGERAAPGRSRRQ